MLKWLITLIMFTVSVSNAQDLVANGNLDVRNVCTEFNALCAPEAWFFLPRYVANSLTTDSVHYCEALCMGNVEKGFWSVNYLYTKLLCPLEKGKKYKLSLWINCGKNYFDHLDVWLGTTEPVYKQVKSYYNQIAFSITEANVDSINDSWRKYNYVFSAKGGEKFIMLGNLSNVPIDKSKIVINNINGNIYYYIDNIALKPIKKTKLVCKEYYSILKQVYDQNKRHPAKLIEDVPLDSTIIYHPFIPNVSINNPGVITAEPPQKLMAEKKKFFSDNNKVLIEIPVQLPGQTSLMDTGNNKESGFLNDTLYIPDILFEYNSARLNPVFLRKLNTLLQKLQNKNFQRLEITGHTDYVGSADYNLKLSLNRALTIKNYIIAKLLIHPDIIFATGLGDTKPRDTNETNEGRQRNRRVEIVVEY